MKNRTRSIALATMLALGIAATASAAWNAPTGTPPNNNASEPINISTTQQFKQGIFGAQTLNIFGTSQYLSFGNTTGSSAPGIRYNTTSSALEFSNGGGTWSAFGGGSGQWTASGNNIYYNTGNVSVGTTGPISVSASRNYISVKGNTDAGMLELSNNSADADGTTVGGIQFSSANYTNATN